MNNISNPDVNESKLLISQLFRFASYILLFIGYIWTASGISKITSGVFPENLGKTLTFFASKNPYGWYRSILVSEVIPRSIILGYVIEWTEALSGIVIIGTGLYMWYKKDISKPVIIFNLIFLTAVIILNFQFYLASGWTSISSSQLNLLMIGIEIALLILFVQIWKVANVK
ncbi:MAG: hypothetical protein M3P33_01805 [bacterium]|nr:hypothetical protein [bacterium]